MIRSSIVACILFAGSAAANESPDLLRLADGELEGRFSGIDPHGFVTWNRDDAAAPLQFRTDNVQQIILGERSGLRADPETSHVTLINDDRIPGRIVGLDDSHLTLDTRIAGTLMIRREHLGDIKPNPFGGRLIYAGPFDREGWETRGPADGKDADDDKAASEDADDKPTAEASDRDWHQRGSYWYSTRGTDVLMLPGLDMPGKSIFRFKAEWRSRPPIEIAFHANFQDPPEVEEDDGDGPAQRARHRSRQSNSDRFGEAYVVTLHSGYARMHHCGYGEDGSPFSHQITGSSTRVNFDDTGEAAFELRSDASTGLISFFINGSFAMQWNVGDHFESRGLEPLQGGGIAFASRGGDQQPLRISEIMVAEWNGVPDSARSLESEDFDIILLTNGTDRFSGDVESIQKGKLRLDGRYATLEIPLEEIAEIHLAKKSRAEHEPTHVDRISVFYQPIGRISGVPSTADESVIQLRSQLIGELELQLSPASLLEFKAANSFLKFWDEDL